jgi:hypothetical protein
MILNGQLSAFELHIVYSGEAFWNNGIEEEKM